MTRMSPKIPSIDVAFSASVTIVWISPALWSGMMIEASSMQIARNTSSNASTFKDRKSVV